MARGVVRRLDDYESALRQAGLCPIAGADEAGRGACAGPLVAAAVILDSSPEGQIKGLNDSKLMTAAARERAYDEIMDKALSVAWVRIEPEECDRLGMHVADIQGLRRALLRLDVRPAYVLTDGFPVDGLGTPGLALWKGDQIAACVAAASVVAKVTRDRIMVDYAEKYPDHGFEVHKGYCTAAHRRALDVHGPTDIHRMSWSFVQRAMVGTP